MNICCLCKETASPQSNYCKTHSEICQTKTDNTICGKPATFGCGICSEHHRVEQEGVDDAVRWIDNHCWDCEWEKINHCLRSMDVANMPPAICIVWLSMTKCVEKHLPARSEFFDKAKDRLKRHHRSLIPPDLVGNRNIDAQVDHVLRGLK